MLQLWVTKLLFIVAEYDLNEQVCYIFHEDNIVDQTTQNYLVCNSILTFPAFHLMGVDFEDGSPVSFKWNSLEIDEFSK